MELGFSNIGRVGGVNSDRLKAVWEGGGRGSFCLSLSYFLSAIGLLVHQVGKHGFIIREVILLHSIFRLV